MVKKIMVKKLFPTCRELLIKKDFEAMRLPFYGKVLVLGAGLDPYKHHIMHEQYVCLDIEHLNNIDVIGDAHALPFSDSTFDCVVATEILEHLKNPQGFIDEVYRVLQKHGDIIITVPFMFHYHAHPNDYLRFTHQGLYHLLSSFDNVEVVGQGGRPHVLLDLISTAFYPLKIMIIFRGLSWLLVRFVHITKSTSPSGFLCIAKKGEK